MGRATGEALQGACHGHRDHPSFVSLVLRLDEIGGVGAGKSAIFMVKNVMNRSMSLTSAES